jgi:5'-3' exoribonuclease 1
LKVIFSGVDVPGEGEHKALEFIRRKTQEEGFNPNTSICIYGADADLIFLALTTHLPFVCIFREQLKPRLRKSPATKRHTTQAGYDFLYINIFREYLEIEFGPLQEKMGERYSIDKIIDDFVFLCFFIGNDFLPRVFCMDIKMGNFDKLIEIFKETLVELDGYINEKGVICWNRAIKLFKKISEFELKFIGDKLEEQVAQQKTAQKYKKFLDEVDSFTVESNKENLEEIEELKEEYAEFEKWEEELEKNMSDGGEDEDENISPPIKKEPINLAKMKIVGKAPVIKSHNIEDEDYAAIEQAANVTNLEVEEAETYIAKYSNEETISRLLSARALENDIKFMSSLVKTYTKNKGAARKYYYIEKFSFDVEKKPEELTNILTAYMQGLQFVLSYYYTNCPSWSWFYPYYYSPLISDLSNLMEHFNLPSIPSNLIKFDYGKPFDPFKQLLLILPIASTHLLPTAVSKLVCDEDEPLHQYYPLEFELDPFGAVFDSEYIAKIPFVEESLLSSQYEKALKTTPLTTDEVLRNAQNENTMFEWDYNMSEYDIKPTLPYFDEFKAKIRTTTFSLESLHFDPTAILDCLPQSKLKYILR